jgi:hypothetical protein
MMRRFALLVSVVLGASAAPACAATVFNFSFDNQGLVPGDGPLAGPIVGTGTFVSPIDLGLGLHNLTDLAGFTFSFSFLDGTTFSNADILTPLAGVAVNITDHGGGVRRLFITESGAPGSNSGPFSGALDLSSGASTLSFEPTFFGGNFLYQQTGSAGRYIALSADAAVPEPATWAMMFAGFGAIGLAMRRRRRPAVRFNFA